MEKTNSFKIVITGYGGVGKSCIILRFLKNIFTEEYDPTLEDNYRHKFAIDSGRNVILELLDTGGYEVLSSPLYTKWFNWGEGFVLVYSVASKESFEEMKLYFSTLLKTKKSKPTIVVIGTQADKTEERSVTFDDGYGFAQKNHCPFLETSSKDEAFTVSDIFKVLIKEMESSRDSKIQIQRPSSPDIKSPQRKLLPKKSRDRLSVEITSPVKPEIEASISVDKSPELGNPPIMKRTGSSRRISIWNIKHYFKDEVLYELEKAPKTEKIKPLKKSKKDRSKKVIFGESLESQIPSGESIPELPYKIFNYLRLEGFIRQEGIFRVSGNLETIRKVRASIEQTGKVEIPKGLDCHATTGVLKQWLTNLPEPLMTYELYPQFITICEFVGQPIFIDLIFGLVAKLPYHNRVLLKALLSLLNDVASHTSENRMNFSNLATVIGPCILFSKIPNGNMQQQLAEISKVTKVVHVLIENYPKLAEVEDIKPPDSPKLKKESSPKNSSFKSKLSKKFSGFKGSKKIAIASPSISKSEENLPETKVISGSPQRITSIEIDAKVLENVVTRQRSHSNSH